MTNDNREIMAEAETPMEGMLTILENAERGHVMQYHIEEPIADALMDELETKQVYKFHRGDQTVTAYRFPETDTEALYVFEHASREETYYYNPPIGETNLDLRWYMTQAEIRNDDFEIEMISDESIESVVESAPPEWEEPLRELIDDKREAEPAPA